MAARYWIPGLLFGALGMYCWVQDPFRTSEGIGSGISSLAGFGCVGISIVVGIIGLILARRLLLMLILVNLLVFSVAALCLTRDSYTAYEDKFATFLSRTNWELVFATLALSVIISVPVYLFLLKSWRRPHA